jgi:hypothetical protein
MAGRLRKQRHRRATKILHAETKGQLTAPYLVESLTSRQCHKLTSQHENSSGTY